MPYSSGPGGVIPLHEVNFLKVEIPSPKPYIFMISVNRQMRPQLLGHFICLFTLIINIYGLGEGISTIKKFTSGRGWGMTPGA
jgi:hypothetical protein